MQEFSDDLLIRVAKVHRPGFDGYVMLRECGRRLSVGFVKGNEIEEIIHVDKLIELYSSRAIDMDAVRWLARKPSTKVIGDWRDADKPLRAEFEQLLQRHGADYGHLAISKGERIKTIFIGQGVGINECRELLSTSFYHIEQSARGEDI